MNRSSLVVIISLISFVLLTSCGRNAKTSSSGGSPNSTPTEAVVTFSSSVTGSIPAGTIITGYDLTFTLPSGVTVTSSAPPVVDNGVVTATGSAAGSALTAVYTPASGASQATVRILIVSANGMNAGEFSSLTCGLAEGQAPDSADFYRNAILFAASGYDQNTNSTVDLTGQLNLTANVTIQ